MNRDERIARARELAAQKKPTDTVTAQQQASRIAQRLASIGASAAQRHVTAAEQSGKAGYLEPTSPEWQRAVQLTRTIAITRAKRRDTITHGEVKWAILDEYRMLVAIPVFEELLQDIREEGDEAMLGAIIVASDTGMPTDDFLLAAMELGFDAPVPALQRQVYEHFG